MQTYRWFEAHPQPESADDPLLKDAIETVQWDAGLIGAKLHRALSGREQHLDGSELSDHPVQNDWNGSAKVALLSLERSEAAWHAIGASTADGSVDERVEAVARLRRDAAREFPDGCPSFVLALTEPRLPSHVD